MISHEQEARDELRKIFLRENGREVMLGKSYDLKVAIDFAEKNTEAKEIFAYTQEDELIGCVWSRERVSCSNKIMMEVLNGK